MIEQDWVMALTVLGIAAICIVISIILANVVNKSAWKAHYEKKAEARNPQNSTCNGAQNSPQINSQSNAIGFVLNSDTQQQNYPTEISTVSENIIVNKTRL